MEVNVKNIKWNYESNVFLNPERLPSKCIVNLMSIENAGNAGMLEEELSNYLLDNYKFDALEFDYEVVWR